MPVTLPVDGDGKLVPFAAAAVAAMDIRQRGVGEEHDHVQYTFGPDGAGCTRKFSCKWDERFNAIIWFVGAVKSYVDSGDTKISRLAPQTDPDVPRWVCTKCTIDPYQFTGEIEGAEEEEDEDAEPNPSAYPVFDRCDLICVYELVPYEVLSDEATTDETDRYVTRPGYPGADITTEGSYVGLPGGVLNYVRDDGATGPAFKPGGSQIPFPVGFTEPSRKLSIIWHRVPRECWGPGTQLFNRVIGIDGQRGYLGALNETTFFGRWSLTQQLVGVEERLLPDPNGLDYAWTLRFLFSDKPVPFGHLGFYYHSTDSTQPGYYQVLRPNLASGGTLDPDAIGDDDSLFHVREMSNVFVVGSA